MVYNDLQWFIFRYIGKSTSCDVSTFPSIAFNVETVSQGCHSRVMLQKMLRRDPWRNALCYPYKTQSGYSLWELKKHRHTVQLNIVYHIYSYMQSITHNHTLTYTYLYLIISTYAVFSTPFSRYVCCTSFFYFVRRRTTFSIDKVTTRPEIMGSARTGVTGDSLVFPWWL